MASAFILFEFLYFIFSSYILFYLPGALLIKIFKIKLEFPTDIYLKVITGITLFTLIMYALSWIHLQLAIYPILLGTIIYSARLKILKFPLIAKEHKTTCLIVLALSLIFSLQMILNGNVGNSIYTFGDDMAHLGYISELKHAFPPQHPGFAGIPLRGYHFFSDFVTANISNTTGLSFLSLYFHFIPLFVALGWGFGAYTILFTWTKKVSAGLLGTFLLLFGSSFSYILLIARHPHASIFNNFGIDQPNMALLNAPYSFSVLFVLAFLVALLSYFKNRQKSLLFVIALLVGITSLFKVYAGIIIISGFVVFLISELIKKNFIILVYSLLSLAIFLTTFGVFAGRGAGLFYLPLWPIERMFDGIFPEYNYKEKIETFSKLHVLKGLILTHLYTFCVFLFGNLGTRFLGILLLPILFKKKRLPSLFSFILLIMALTSILLPLFFAQTIKVFDMIQMAWYYPVLMSLFGALGFSAFFSLKLHKSIKTISLLLLLSATIPLFIYTIVLKIIPIATIQRLSMSGESFAGFNYLKSHGSYNDTVLDLPVGPQYTNFVPVANWHESRSLDIPAFGEKRLYVGNQYIVFPNMPRDERLNFLIRINKTEFEKKTNNSEVKAIIAKIKQEKIVYIYTHQNLHIFEGRNDIKIVFQNPQTTIYKVN